MSSRTSPLIPAVSSYEHSPHHQMLVDLIDLVALYVEHAENAARVGRLRSSHGLFQTAITFYDQACHLRTKYEDESGTHLLDEARRKIDACAQVVYEDARVSGVFSDELLGHSSGSK